MNAQPCYTDLDTVICGDALTVLRGMPDNSVDAIVTDPPAGIAFMGKDWDNFSDSVKTKIKPDAEKYGGKASMWKQSGGSAQVTRKERDAFIHFLQEVMTEALRVLKPGGHALVWALPRTSHWTALALEDAGFEIRDCVYHIFGSGFPKSTAIDKQIDKMKGAEREVTGQDKSGLARAGTQLGDDNWKGLTRKVFDLKDKPATPEAQQWQGWGSSLKPAVECWWLCRKPLSEKGLAANVLKYGTGGLNVDACRVGYQGEADLASTEKRLTGLRESSVGNNTSAHHEGWRRPWMDDTDKLKSTIKTNPQGRFPSHLLLSHSIWCVPTGTKRVRVDEKPHSRQGTLSRDKSKGWGMGNAINGTGYADSDGYEQIDAYECHESCPILQLDLQGGYRKSGNTKGSTYGGMFGNGKEATTPIREASEGFVSRYFQQFPPDSLFAEVE